MDAKITKKRLNLFLSYEWIKVVALIVGVIVLWSLIFTTTATRITPAQQFTIFNYMGTNATMRFGEIDGDLKRKNVFSYDVLSVTPTDVNAAGKEGATLMQTRLMTNEGDALFVGGKVEFKDAEFVDDQGKPYTPTYLQQFLTAYQGYACELTGEEGYLARMESYLKKFYGESLREENATLDMETVEKVFRERVKTQKDKRFKKESEIKKGIKQEAERLALYRKNLLKFEENCQNGYIALEETTLYLNGKNGIEKKTGVYSVNLCPDKRMANLRDIVYYTVTETDSEGIEHKNVPTAADMQLVLLDTAGSKYEYSLFENIALVNYLVEKYCDPTATV